MAVYLTEVVTDLAMPPQQRPIPHQFAMGDNNAYTITALLCDSRNPEAELLDGTVGGELVRPDGVTVALAGEKGDAVRQVNLAAGGLCNATPCSVTLPQACFAVPGRVTLTIKLTDGTTITQALSVSAVVVRTSTDEAVDPGEVIPDLAAIQAAASEAAEAAEDATAAAADARAAASSAVRYDTAQSLTVAQKAQARGNIAAASLIPSGTAFSQAVQGGTTYDVQDARVSPLDERVNALHTLVNYGYDISASNDHNLKSRVGTRVVLDGTTTGNTSTKIILTGEPMWVRSGVFPSTVTSGVRLTNGHRYRLYTVYISGSTQSWVNPCWTAPGSWTPPTGTVTYGDGYCILDYNTTDYPNGAIAYLLTPKDNTLSDYTVQVLAEDITYGEAEDGNFAPVDTPTATSTHTTGSLLMMGGQLYKATQAIAPGAVITPGTNVSPTTVAAQLAQRDTAIAGRAKSGAIAGSLSNNPSVGDLVMDSTGDLFVVSEVDTPNVGDVSLTPTTVAEQLAALAARIAALEANT